MEEVCPDELKRAVEAQHGGTATPVRVVPIDEHLDGLPAWQGTVHVFNLTGNAQSNRAYAWSSLWPDGTRRFYAVLHNWRVTTPAEAVRAAIVAENKSKK